MTGALGPTERAWVQVPAEANQLTQNTIAAHYRESATTLNNYNATQRVLADGGGSNPLIIGDKLDILVPQHLIGCDVWYGSNAHKAGWGAIGLPLLNSGLAHAKSLPNTEPLIHAGYPAYLGAYVGAVTDELEIAWWEMLPTNTSLVILDLLWYLDTGSGARVPNWDIMFGLYSTQQPMTKVAESLFCDFPYDGRMVNIRHAKFALLNPPVGDQVVRCLTTISTPAQAETQLLQGKCTFYSDAQWWGPAVKASGVSDLASVTVPLTKKARVQCSIMSSNGVLLDNFKGHKRFEYTNAPATSGANFPIIIGDNVASANLKFSARLDPVFYWSAIALPIPAEEPSPPVETKHYIDDFTSYPVGQNLSIAPWASALGAGMTVQAGPLLQGGDTSSIYLPPLGTNDFEVSVRPNVNSTGSNLIYLDIRANPSRPGGWANGAHIHLMIDYYSVAGALRYQFERQPTGQWYWTAGIGNGGVAQDFPGQGWVAGDKFTLRAQGNVYTVLKNDVPQASWTDSGNLHPIDADHRCVAIGSYNCVLRPWFEAKDI